MRGGLGRDERVGAPFERDAVRPVRPHLASEAFPGFEQGDVGAGPGRVVGPGEPGDPSAHHDQSHGARLSAWTTTRTSSVAPNPR